jgi:CubicO group peptidase (beta-lactamase class C family)
MAIQQDIKRIFEKGKFNGKVLITNKNTILFQSSFGYDNIDEQKPFKDDAIFRIGSITKQFTAVAILQLVEKGSIHLDDSLQKFFPNCPYQETITIHHLLSNSSGIPNFNPFDDYSELLSNNNFYQEMIHQVIFQQPLHFQPGDQFEYSSSGYFILSEIVSIISKMPYHTYLQQNIFNVLDMSNTGFHFIETALSNFVTLYDIKNNQPIATMEIDMRLAYGGGGLYASIEDLHKWNNALISGEVITPLSLQKMFAIQININENAGYGYGVVVKKIKQDNNQYEEIYHPGNGPGVFAQNTLIDRKLQIIILSNVNDKITFHHCFNELYQLIKSHLEKLLHS